MTPGTPDPGFGAEDVAAVEPLFTFPNDKGEIRGVRYDRLSVVFVNAFKEQQAQIARQQKQIDESKQLVCRANPDEEACKASIKATGRKKRQRARPPRRHPAARRR